MPEIIDAPAVIPESVELAQSNAPAEESTFADAFADLDRFAESKAAAAPKSENAETPKPEKSKSSKTEAPKQEEKEVPDQKTEKPKTEKPAAEKTEKPLPIPEIRKAYDKLKAEHAALRAEMEKASKPQPKDESADNEWKTKLTEYEKRIEAERKRASELDAIVKQTAFEHSDEYRRTYIEPIVNAVKTGQQAMVGMTYTDAQGESRPAVPEDFNEVLSATDWGRARQIAKARFPDESAEVMSLWKDVKSRVESKDAALVKWKEESSQREQQRIESEKALSDSRNKSWQAGHSALRQKYPDLFNPVEGDEEGNAMLDAGIKRAEAIFCGGKLKDDKGNEYQPTDEDMVKLHLESYLKTAGFNRLARDKRVLKKEVEQLKAQLAEYQKSVPGTGDGGKQPDKPEHDWSDDLAKFAKSTF